MGDYGTMPISCARRAFPLEMWDVFWGRTRWRAPLSVSGDACLDVIDEETRRESDTESVTRWFGPARAERAVVTRRIFVARVGGRCPGRPASPSPWVELRARVPRVDRGKGDQVEMRLTFNQSWYGFELPYMLSFSILTTALVMMTVSDPVDRAFFTVMSILAFGTFLVVYPAVVYAANRRDRARLIALGNRIQARLAAVDSA